MATIIDFQDRLTLRQASNKKAKPTPSGKMLKAERRRERLLSWAYDTDGTWEDYDRGLYDGRIGCIPSDIRNKRYEAGYAYGRRITKEAGQ
jgi:hypothetical protein